MTPSTLGCRHCTSLPAWSSALAIVPLFEPAPLDADPSFVERTEANLEAVFFLPTAKCNLIVCFVGTDAEVNLTCADKMPAVGILSGIQK